MSLVFMIYAFQLTNRIHDLNSESELFDRRSLTIRCRATLLFIRTRVIRWFSLSSKIWQSLQLKAEVPWDYSFRWFLTFVFRISETFAVVRLIEKNRCIYRIILLISYFQNIFKFNCYIFESNDWFCFIKNLNLIYVSTEQKSIKIAFYISHQWRNKNLKSVV